MGPSGPGRTGDPLTCPAAPTVRRSTDEAVRKSLLVTFDSTLFKKSAGRLGGFARLAIFFFPRMVDPANPRTDHMSPGDGLSTRIGPRAPRTAARGRGPPVIQEWPQTQGLGEGPARAGPKGGAGAGRVWTAGCWRDGCKSSPDRAALCAREVVARGIRCRAPRRSGAALCALAMVSRGPMFPVHRAVRLMQPKGLRPRGGGLGRRSTFPLVSQRKMDKLLGRPKTRRLHGPGRATPKSAVGVDSGPDTEQPEIRTARSME